MVDISIVIRTYNEARWLPELLEAIGRQDLREFTGETVIVDSGSTDDTLKIARKFGCRIVGIEKERFTFGRSLNYGCDAAAGNWLVFISGHCIPTDADWLYNLVLPLAEGSCSYTYGRQEGRPRITKYSEEQLFKKYFPEMSAVPQDGFFCNNANAALSKAAWQIHPFDEELTGLEDMALAKKIYEAGHGIGYVADSSVYHIHEEGWRQVKRRYEREAIALKSIMPEVHVSFTDFVRYLAAGIFFDWSAALVDRKLSREWLNICKFRLMQFYGTYRGNHEHRHLSRRMKEQYFYPNKKKSFNKPRVQGNGDRVDVQERGSAADESSQRQGVRKELSPSGR